MRASQEDRRDHEAFRFRGEIRNQILAIPLTTASVISTDVLVKCVDRDGKPLVGMHDNEADVKL